MSTGTNHSGQGTIVSQCLEQGLSQCLETGCPKLPILKFLGIQNFKGDHNTKILTINMYKFIKIMHDILIQCHRNNMGMIKFDYMLEIDIVRILGGGVLRGAF